jgi:hypothetical protein
MPIPNEKPRPRLARRAARRDEADLGKAGGANLIQERSVGRIFNLTDTFKD